MKNITLVLTWIMYSVCYAAETYQHSDCAWKIEKNGMSLLNKGINLIDPNIRIAGRFHEALKDLYQNVNKQHILNVTEKYLRHVSTEDDGKIYYAVDTFNKKTEFEEKYIYLYTTYAVYKKMNSILREHDCTIKTLTEEDLYYAPFSVVLMSVLMYWPKLTEFRGPTYRGVNLTATDFNKYTINKRFVWTHFTSTSTHKDKAFDRNVTFIINNNHVLSYMAPKPVYRYAWKSELMEALYCPGAEFKVLKVEKNITNSIFRATITLQAITATTTSTKTVTTATTSNSTDCMRYIFTLNIIIILLFLSFF